MYAIGKMFDPAVMALIGATERQGTVGRTILENLLSSKERRVYPINPHEQRVLGRDTLSSIAQVPGPVDLAIIATPAKTVPDLVEECGRAGVKGVVIVSAGFKEIGEEGKRLEARIADTGGRYGMRILGPNCIGFARPTLGINATFLTKKAPAGNIAFLSQSGALGGAILGWAIDAGIGLSMFASLGSMVDLDFGDLIDFLGTDGSTKSILIYMEGVGNARKFMSAARAFARQKPIIVVKPGRFAESARAAHSHTGAMAGDNAVYDAAFRRAGVVRVREIADLFDAAEILDSTKLPRGPRLAIVTNAGGPGIMATDALLDMGAELAKLSPETIEALNASLPPYWSKGNPIDVLGDADVGRYVKALTACLTDPMVDGLHVIYQPLDGAPPKDFADAVSLLAKGAHKPVVVTWLGTKDIEKDREILVDGNIPTYGTPEEAVRAYVNMHRYKRHLDHLYETPAELPAHKAPPTDELRACIKKTLKGGRTLLNEEESKRFLSTYGIPSAMPRLATSLGEALTVTDEIGYPVAMKIVSPDISHKTEVGGAILNIPSREALENEYTALMKRIRERLPKAAVTGVAIEEMLQEVDYELILGAKKDKEFGTVILFGMGGITAEFVKDFSVGLPPLNQTLAKMLMEETRVYRMLQGFRGKSPANLEELEEILVGFSNLIVDFPEIAEIDINPLAVSNGKAHALDARIIIDGTYTESKGLHPHLVIAPYPTRYITPWKLSDGTEVLLRPIRPEDEPLEREMLATLSEEATKWRFFSMVRPLDHEWLIVFCNIDYDRHMAIVAEVKEKGKRRIIGVARLIKNPDLVTAEFAVLVHDAYQGRGLGYKLTEMLIAIGRRGGLKGIEGQLLTGNTRMFRICRDLGFSYTLKPDGITEVMQRLK